MNNNGFFRDPRTIFLPNFVKIGRIFFAYIQTNEQTPTKT